MPLGNLKAQLPGSQRSLNEYVKDALMEACKEAARPLVRLCIKHGISFSDLIAALKYVFVDSAIEDYLEQTQSSTSRIGILTGIPKTQVAGIRDTEPESKSVAARMQAAAQVLSAWHSDPDFTGPYGIPLDLTYGSSSGFEGLADRYGNGLPAEEILDDLIRAGCVAKGKRRSLRVVRRTYLSGSIDPASIGYAGRCIKTLAETLEYNLERTESEEKRFQRQFISTLGIRVSDLPAFNELLKEAGQKFLEDLDSWTTEREKALKNLEKIPNEIPRVYPGVGLYMFFSRGPAKKEVRAR
jgi:hypothetical protein